MNVLYLSLSYVPSRRASSVHVMRMCAALARAGHGVRLVAKRSDEEVADDFAFYGVPRGFELEKLARPAVKGGGMVFAAGLAGQLVRRRSWADLVYSRDVVGALLATQLRMPAVYEAHGIPARPAVRRALRRVLRRPSLRALVVISEALRRDLAAEDLLPPHAPTIVAHDAADAPPLPLRVPRTGRPRLGYIGNLYRGRGVELVVELAGRLPSCDVELVGGTERDLAYWRAQHVPANARFVGFVAPGELTARYATYDALLMPYPRSGIGVASDGGVDTSRWCSPMKMFEYMAAGAPIVTSDLPVLGEILRDGENALVAPAGDAAAWERAIRRLLDEPQLASRLAHAARTQLEREHTWDARVARILGHLRAT
ncbi:MAG TPA: glycosyltransferase family 4 protein [Kofleriaceae bacterium]